MSLDCPKHNLEIPVGSLLLNVRLFFPSCLPLKVVGTWILPTTPEKGGDLSKPPTAELSKDQQAGDAPEPEDKESLISDLRQKVTKSQESITRLELEKKALMTKISELEIENSERRQNITLLERENTENKFTITRLERENSENLSKRAQLEQESIDLRANVASENKQNYEKLAKLNRENVELSSKLLTLERENSEILGNFCFFNFFVFGYFWLFGFVFFEEGKILIGFRKEKQNGVGYASLRGDYPRIGSKKFGVEADEYFIFNQFT